ncbi:hypothetical protein [Crateriforma conspicua]|uniref:Uncharacterized protein n=1 Tax=Crateriforma conspicua TaxID=2527996 RepID=A0A5C5XT79_9PLAN|nr:hypothetical protein [Crateriforma conspicua]TWT65878.1 hypothetical protein Pan14r_54300 [Crateriforma conspicua]
MPKIAIRDLIVFTGLVSLAFAFVRINSELSDAAVASLVWSLLVYKSLCHSLRFAVFHAIAIVTAFVFRYSGDWQFLTPSHWMFYWILADFCFLGMLISSLIVWVQTIAALRQLLLRHGFWLICVVPTVIFLFLAESNSSAVYAAMAILAAGLTLTFTIPFASSSNARLATQPS